MNSVIPVLFRYSVVLIFSVLFVSGCSSSSSTNSDEAQSNNSGGSVDGSTDGAATVLDDATSNGNDTSTDTESDSETSSTTRVNFEITVPAYSSNALQVQLVWGDIATNAIWNIDELWTASVDFPTNTDNQLLVTFSDDNGATTLGTVEKTFSTGANQSENVQITANEFDTNRWDSNGDGVSNLSELLTGTTDQAIPEFFTTSLEVLPTKTVRLSWEQSIGASYYQVLENQTGSAGFVPVSTNLASDTRFYDHQVALYKSLSARYVIEACNSLGCTLSDELFVEGMLNSGVGSLTVSDPEFINSLGLTISADGQTLAFMATRDEETEEERTRPYSSSVYIYKLSEGAWQQQAKVDADNADTGDFFGADLSLSRDGTVLAVGAQNEKSAASGINGDGSDNSLAGSGAVYMFALSDGKWQQEAYIKASDPEQYTYFGRELDLSGDGETLAVTAPYHSSGDVYIFTYSNGSWQQQAKVSSERGSISGGFLSLSENGDKLATGVHVLSRLDGNWQVDTVLEREDYGAAPGFGSNGMLSDDGMTLIISSDYDRSRATGINPPDEDRFVNATLNQSGAVHVFALLNDSWVQQAYIKPTIAENYTYFGRDVSISSDGNTLAVASRENTVGTGIFNSYTNKSPDISDGHPDRTGAIYIYRRSAGVWSQEAYVKPAQDLFRFWGAPVLDGAGDTLVVSGSYEGGAIYIY